VNRARYIMVGGFLGAGKTTAIGHLARRLADGGSRVGLITNDQGAGLVDSKNLRAQGFAVEEIAGGCFCCRFDSLLTAARALAAQERPDVFLAEPVGSCTDLVATVSYPLRRIYGDEFDIAPLSVLVDPLRAERVLGLECSGRSFSSKVLYVFEKQLEEADFIVVNKVDLLDEARTARLTDALSERFPSAEVLCVGARDGVGVDEWFERITTETMGERKTLDIDYDLYAEGEALLGWLNATVELDATDEVDGNAIVRELARDIQDRLEALDAEVAHLKMTLSPHEDPIGEIAVISLVRNDWVPEVCLELGDLLAAGQLVINLRAEAAPETLRATVEAAVAAVSSRRPGVRATLDHVESFRPGRPEPTHRLSATGDPT